MSSLWQTRLLEMGPHVTALPVVHGSADFAWEIRRLLLKGNFDCLAIPLPASFREPVIAAVLKLPQPSLVVQAAELQKWFSEKDVLEPTNSEDEFVSDWISYVPIDPCQPVIAAIRVALEERIPIHFIDWETREYRPLQRAMPDAQALKQVTLEKYAAAVAPFLEPADDPQWQLRMAVQAHHLRELSLDYRRVAWVTSVLDWPFIRQAFFESPPELPADEVPAKTAICYPDAESLYFLLGELPFITSLYETARAQLDDDSSLTIDGVKHLLVGARKNYLNKLGKRARRITPRMLAQCLCYIRNLTLIEHNLTPQLITIVTAAKQIGGDSYAIEVLNLAKTYAFPLRRAQPRARLGIDQISLVDGPPRPAVSRLPGPPLRWAELELNREPSPDQKALWQQKWNPYSQCSWPPEDQKIENFRRTVFERAREIIGADLAKTEKFTTSLRDGIDIRDTLRNWHSGEIYVRVLPPHQGKLDCAVMLFDSPADPRDYPWRTTWFAEHSDESTLAFFATNFAAEPVGPGICLATYGGALFLYPPVSIPDIWTDPRLDFTETLEERLLAAACLHSQSRQIALLSPGPPGAAWRRLAKHFGKTWVHLPLAKFGDSTVQQLRMVHVLNGKDVRSYAAHYIRRV